jgi:hypothetical protein
MWSPIGVRSARQPSLTQARLAGSDVVVVGQAFRESWERRQRRAEELRHGDSSCSRMRRGKRHGVGEGEAGAARAKFLCMGMAGEQPRRCLGC